MAAPRFGRFPTCLNCLRQLTRLTPTSIAPPASLIQSRSRTTKAELEDLQGIPVRLLQDIIGFGRKHAIIRVKPGRMRNFWFPKGLAEYMTRNRFKELGLTESAIGVRDRTFGTRLVLDEDKDKSGKKVLVEEEPVSRKKKEVLTLPPEETQSLLTTLLPPTLTFARKPITTPAPEAAPEPVVPRSPSLAPTAAASQTAGVGDETPAAATAIFGSVSTNDILHVVKEALAVDSQGSRVALEAESVLILGLEAGEDRIKKLGTFEVEISPGKDLDPVRRTVEVIPEE
ncbi:hypothetical protein DL764_003603 [Monosporascus ibericus]|uniref:Ribosomal protein L9 domain-containing protein n=1 Tax=Monosporascus ibericus TaxID=155417 RepID=A0A4Q4TFX3_9PEZI|nr:hypothetical protein DL764_003603 [Monosporascus ibericus]